MNGDATLKWWVQRLDDNKLTHGPIFKHDGRLTLRFEDPEGQRLAFIDDRGEGNPPAPWDRSPVPKEHQIRGLRRSLPT